MIPAAAIHTSYIGHRRDSHVYGQLRAFSASSRQATVVLQSHVHDRLASMIDPGLLGPDLSYCRGGSELGAGNAECRLSGLLVLTKNRAVKHPVQVIESRRAEMGRGIELYPAKVENFSEKKRLCITCSEKSLVDCLLPFPQLATGSNEGRADPCFGSLRQSPHLLLIDLNAKPRPPHEVNIPSLDFPYLWVMRVTGKIFSSNVVVYSKAHLLNHEICSSSSKLDIRC